MDGTEESDRTKAEAEKELDQALKDTFPGSDPVQLTDPSQGVGKAPKEPRPEPEKA
ncbi:hypothetical protein [Roseococcus sp. SYP-B2431]|uniref:hypothetical protein n=1 Tax=Roseococcus sp. SYP-B2431 TaxID=2496640 RepID=UPI0013F46343|nr:hypothetical protein [Roseococcus sp. SYP-B2431]